MISYRQKWIPPATIDDYMFEIIQNVWWGNKERAIRQVIWVMENYLGDENGTSEEETAIS